MKFIKTNNKPRGVSGYLSLIKLNAMVACLMTVASSPAVYGQEKDSTVTVDAKPAKNVVKTDSSALAKKAAPVLAKKGRSAFDKRLFFAFNPIYEGEILSKFLDPLSDLDYYNYNKSYSDFKANIFAIQKRKSKKRQKYDFGYGLQMSRTRSLRDEEIGVGSIVTFDRRMSDNMLSMGVVYLPDFATFDRKWDMNFSHSIFLEVKLNLRSSKKVKKKR